MKNPPHPSSQLSAYAIEVIRSNVAAAEQAERLLQPQLDLVKTHNWFNLFVPEQYGGLNLSLPEAVRLEEALAWADGSLGWVVTLCSGAAMFVGFFENQLAEEVFSIPDVCLAGSGQINGKATLKNGKYVVNGNWPYASGALHATHFTANCVIEKDGQPIITTMGEPLVKSFVFKKDEVQLESNWHYIGLNATAGHSFSVTDVEVPEYRSFVISSRQAYLPGPVYHYPFLQMAEVTLAANISGMCINFFDLCKDLLKLKVSRPGLLERGLEQLALAESETQGLRQDFYDCLDHSWLLHWTQKQGLEEALLQVSKSCRILVSRSREWVDKLYPFCGLTAARLDEPINQVWRNIHTASQHSLLV